MKKILFKSLTIFILISLYSCNNSETSEKDLDENQDVVARDTIVTEYEVEETVVEYDTTKRKRTVDVDIKEER
jgi:hypothetical protein